MRLISFLATLLLAISCQQPVYRLVTVVGIPQNSRSIVVLAENAGRTPIEAPEPFEVPQPAPASATLLLNLSTGFQGDLAVNIGVFDAAGGQGCLIATGGDKENPFTGANGTLRITLNKIASNSAACSGKTPLLLSAEPDRILDAGGETVTLRGWGFRSDSAVTIGGKPAQLLQYVSAAEVQVTAPAKAGLGPTPTRLTNGDGSFDESPNLLRYYVSTPVFFEASLDKNADLGEPGEFVYGKFGVQGPGTIAVTLPKKNAVKFLSLPETESQAPPQVALRDPMAPIVSPGPIVSGDFDRDGLPDLAVANIGDGSVQILRNAGAGIFSRGDPISAGTMSSLPSILRTDDVDKDSRLDLVLTNKGDNQVAVVWGDQTKGVFKFDVCKTPVGLVLNDFDGEIGLDIGISCQGDSTLGVFFLQPSDPRFVNDMITGRAVLRPVDTPPTTLIITDADYDGILDGIILSPSLNTVSVFAVLGVGMVRSYTLSTDKSPRGLSIGDVNFDGYDDIIVPCYDEASDTNSINIFLNKKGAGFESVTPIKQAAVTCSKPYQAMAVHADFDNKLDIVFLGDKCISILHNNSN